MKWISVEDRLPKINTPVLVRVAYQPETVIASVDSDKLWSEQAEYVEVHGDAYATHRLDYCDISHWMPLPDPPEDRGNVN